MIKKIILMMACLLLLSCASFGKFDISQPLLPSPDEEIDYQSEPIRISWDIYEPSAIKGRCHMVYFAAYGCPSCARMDEVLKDEDIIIAIERFYYPVRIMEGDEYFSFFNVREMPTLVFFNPNGIIVKLFEVKVQKKELLTFLFDPAHNQICK